MLVEKKNEEVLKGNDELERIFKTYFVDAFLQSDLSTKKYALPKNASFIFRGITYYEFPIISGAARRFNTLEIKTNRPYKQDVFIEYHKNIIQECRNIEGNNEKSDIDCLASIQHMGGATCLIDFSFNYLMALYFASDEYINPKTKNKEDGCVFKIDLENKINGKIFLLNKTYQQKSIDEILTKQDYYENEIRPRVWLWKPRQINNRIRKQESVFLFSLDKADNHKNIEYERIRIESGDKLLIRKILKMYFNIYEKTVYDDLPGFSSIYNDVNAVIDESLIKRGTCYSIVRDMYREERWDMSLYYAEEVLNCRKKKIEKNTCEYYPCENNIVEVYFYKGLSLGKKKEYYSSLLAFFRARAANKNDINKQKRENDINIEIVKTLFELDQYKKIYRYSKNNMDLYPTSIIWPFYMIESALMIGEIDIFYETMELLKGKINNGKINQVSIYNLYVYIALSLYMYNEDLANKAEIEVIRKSKDNLLNIPNRKNDFINKDGIIEWENTEESAMNDNEKIGIYDISLIWEFDRIKKYINQKSIDDLVKKRLIHKIGETEIENRHYYEKYILKNKPY
jgi:hypothetical protein